jgi:polar amino acid transport system permease protein
MLDFEFIRDNWMFIAGGLGETLIVSLLSILLATFLALIVAAGRHSTIRPFNILSTFYVSLIDGIPLYLQIFFIYLILPQFGISLPGLWAAVLALGINYGAKMSETFHAGFASLGTPRREVMQSMIRPISREFIAIIKDSTFISVTTGFLHDVMWRAARVGRAQFKNMEALIIAAAIYWILIMVVSYLFKKHKDTLPGSSTRPEASVAEL